MSQENVELVRGGYERWNREGTASVLDWLDPELEIETSIGLFDADPVYRGHAGVRRLLGRFWDEFDEARVDVRECVPVGEDFVLVGVHYYGVGKSSGLEFNLDGWQVWTVRNGKAVRWQLFDDRTEALEAVGLRE